MANYYGTARTNYFRVKNRKKFKEYVDTIPDAVLIDHKDADGRMMYGYYMANEYGSFPSWLYDEETGDEIEIDIVTDIVPHLAKGEIAIFMECGAEKCRYLTGNAIAINSEGKHVSVDINDIYALAAKKLGGVPTRAEY